MIKTKINKRIKSFDGVARRISVPEVQTSPVLHYSYKDLFLSGFKVVGVGVVALVLSFGLGKVGGTVSYYSNIAKSEGNKLEAGTLSINISSVEDVALRTIDSGDTEDALVENVVPEEVSTGSLQFDVEVANQGSLPVVYTVQGILDEGNPDGCEEISILANLGVYSYDGLVKNFLSSKITDLGEWNFMISLPVTSSALAPSAVCSGSVVFRAGMAGVTESISNTYTDAKVYTFKIRNWESVVPAAFTTFEEVMLPEEEVGVKEEETVEVVPSVEEETEVQIETVPETVPEVVEEQVVEDPVALEVVQPVVEVPADQ